MKFKKAIIDADPLVYRCGFAIENYDYKEKKLISVEPVHHAYYNIKSILKKVFAACNPDEFSLYLTGKDNFRFDIDPKYKCGRIGARRPTHYDALRQYLIDRFGAVIIDGQEADDECSIQHYKIIKDNITEANLDCVVCSIDKDFDNIPGWHFNYVKNELYFISELEALKTFYLQILTGDKSDSILRIKKGWMKKKTEEKLQKALDEPEMYAIIQKEAINVLYKELTAEFTENGFGQLELDTVDTIVRKLILERGRLVWLRRESGEMWSPKL